MRLDASYSKTFLFLADKAVKSLNLCYYSRSMKEILLIIYQLYNKAVYLLNLSTYLR